MARLSRNLFCFVFILLFVTNEVTQYSNARILLVEDVRCTEKCPERKHVTEENGATNPNQAPSPPGVDAFRPTTPGHSPGVGHSVHN